MLNTNVDYEDIESPLKTDMKMVSTLIIDPGQPPIGKSLKTRRHVFYDEITRIRVVDDEDHYNYLNVVSVDDTPVY